MVKFVLAKWLGGNVHVVWRELDPSDHSTEEIFYKTLRGSWASDVNLSNGDEVSDDPSMIVTSDNSVHVAWIAADRTIAYRKWEGDWQPIVHLSDGSAARPFLTKDRANNLYLFYSGAKPPSPSATQLMLIRFAEPSVHTPVGTDVRVELEGHSVTFSEITEAGVTTIAGSSEGTDLSSDYQLACTPPQYFDIGTTARYRAPIDICLSYDDSVCTESEMQLLHNRGDTWEDITTSIDTDNNIICGRLLGRLSEFALVRPAGASPGFSRPMVALAVAVIAIFLIWAGFRRFRRAGN